MKQAPVGPEERKAILKKIYHALRQSPMFTHYSVEHIRDSAIKSEQLTFDRSFTKQEYMQAMHTKLAKIEKSYVMNSEEILREMGNKSSQIKPEPIPVNGAMGMFRDPMGKPHQPEMDEYSMHSQKKTGQEFVSLTSNPQGRGINFSFIPDDSRMPRIRPINNKPNSHAGMGGVSGSGIMGMQMGNAGGVQAYQHNLMGINKTHQSQKQEMFAPQSNSLNGHMMMSSHGVSGLGTGVGLHTGAMGGGFNSRPHGGSGMGASAMNSSGMFAGSINGCTGGSSSAARGYNPVPNIIKLDPITDLGHMQSPRTNRSEVKTVEVKEMKTPRDLAGEKAKKDGFIGQTMGRMEPFVSLGGFGSVEEINSFNRMRGLDDHMGDMQGISLGMGGISLGPTLHRSGSAGSTNTATKLNNSNRMHSLDRASKANLSMAGVHEIKPVEIKIEEKARARDKTEKIDSPVSNDPMESPRAKPSHEKKKDQKWREDIEQILMEVEKMREVIATHKSIFSRWEKQRKVFYDLEAMLHQTIEESPGNMEGVQGIFQQLKRHIIALTMEIKEGKSLTFKKRLGRISSAFMQKQKMQPEYQFMSTEELLLEYN
ncbi:hypothetical protein NEMIN01_1111 [Nematocida minor]|uniref:uncharacterized protein n=1 Tax=Nematocida minor TaxID=1912983 RepID=UPI0022201B4B|nr:uncharacterized protein NEMIN01_1111 [Nematocida minor]KAI5190573.1 hypothetical protein NEMIN01_1111 [Nematocida minor]